MDLEQKMASLERKIVILSNVLGRVAVAEEAGHPCPAYAEVKTILEIGSFSQWYGQLGLKLLEVEKDLIKKITQASNAIQRETLLAISEQDLDNLLSEPVKTMLQDFFASQSPWEKLLDEKFLTQKLKEYDLPCDDGLMEKFQRLLSVEGREKIARSGLSLLYELHFIFQEDSLKELARQLQVEKEKVVETLLARAKAQETTGGYKELDVYGFYHIQKMVKELIDETIIDVIHLLEDAWQTTEKEKYIFLLLGCELSLRRNFVRAAEILFQPDSSDSPRSFKTILEVLFNAFTQMQNKVHKTEEGEREKIIEEAFQEEKEDILQQFQHNLSLSPSNKFSESLAIALETMHLDPIMEDGSIDFSKEHGAFSSERYFPLLPIGNSIPKIQTLEAIIVRIKKRFPKIQEII